MGLVKKIVKFRLGRFVIVGVCNTIINFAILNFAFYSLHQGKLVSSFIATGCAVIFSFILNRNFVFLDKERPTVKLIIFIAVTVSGILIVQNSVYALGIYLLHNHEVGVINFIHSIFKISLSKNFVDVNLSNVVASLFVMVWNYNGYRLFVFRNAKIGNEIYEIESN
jgi:putative flippase GtrA